MILILIRIEIGLNRTKENLFVLRTVGGDMTQLQLLLTAGLKHQFDRLDLNINHIQANILRTVTSRLTEYLNCLLSLLLLLGKRELKSLLVLLMLREWRLGGRLAFILFAKDGKDFKTNCLLSLLLLLGKRELKGLIVLLMLRERQLKRRLALFLCPKKRKNLKPNGLLPGLTRMNPECLLLVLGLEHH